MLPSKQKFYLDLDLETLLEDLEPDLDLDLLLERDPDLDLKKRTSNDIINPKTFMIRKSILSFYL